MCVRPLTNAWTFSCCEINFPRASPLIDSPFLFKTSRNFKIQLVFALISLIIGSLLQISKSSYLILVATIMSVLILETLNTSIETIVDLVIKKEFSNLAKIAKDTSAGAVLLASINSVIIGVYIFIPKIKLLF